MVACLTTTACGVGNKASAPQGETASLVAAPVTDAAAPEAATDAGASATESPWTADGGRLEGLDGGKMCGCGLCAPVVSDDACSQDSDCAPAVPCHADKCVARAKAKARRPDTVCTMSMRCDSVDANTCGCLAGKCALSPRNKP